MLLVCVCIQSVEVSSLVSSSAAGNAPRVAVLRHVPRFFYSVLSSVSICRVAQRGAALPFRPAPLREPNALARCRAALTNAPPRCQSTRQRVMYRRAPRCRSIPWCCALLFVCRATLHASARHTEGASVCSLTSAVGFCSGRLNRKESHNAQNARPCASLLSTRKRRALQNEGPAAKCAHGSHVVWTCTRVLV